MFPSPFTDYLSWTFALLGMICLAGWPLCRTPRAMLSIQLGAVLGLSLHYMLLGMLTAATVNALGAVQIAVTCYSAAGLACVGSATFWP
jgi:hypothetical protein